MSASRAVVRAFAPASVSNVGCGFDVFGFAVAGPGDVVEARRRAEPGIVVAEITGDDGRLPRDPARNTAAVAAARLLELAAGGERPGGEGVGRSSAHPVCGVELHLAKGMPLASGLGSSAASGVAAVVAVDALFGLGAPRETLLAAAVAGERAASGAAHADNAAPSLYGGFVLVRPGLPGASGLSAGGGDPLPRVEPLPVPDGLACALVRPHLEVETRAARAALPAAVPLADAVVHWGNTAALVAGLFRGDFELIAGAVEDLVAEPVRSGAVPGFAAVKAAARAAGALGCSLSGSGPTIFALCRGLDAARRVAAAMGEALAAEAGLAADLHVSPVGAPGARLLAVDEAPGDRSR